MTNNDIFRQLRYIFHLTDEHVVSIFKAAEIDVKKEDIIDWLKKDETEQLHLKDAQLSYFLDGLINHKRGKKEGYQPILNNELTNNQILKKLKIALNYKGEDVLEIFSLVNVSIGKHELSAFFRNPDKGQYQEMGNQYLRNYLHGLKLKIRPEK